MALPGLVSVRLGAFKSHREQQLLFEPITLIVGRNASGKSNALDALSLLALLADERDVNDLEQGDREVAGLRGGLRGATPFGSGTIRVGCTAETSAGELLVLDIELEAADRAEVVSERLTLQRNTGREIVLLEAKRQGRGEGISDVNVYSAGYPRTFQMLSTRLACVQAVTKVPQDTKARRLVVESCEELVASLRGIFVLDPVPAQMRAYVRIGSPPDRAGSTVSALAYDLREDDEAWSRLFQLLEGLVETKLEDIRFAEGKLPDGRLVDVMVALVERAGRYEFTTPAQLMSDGTLRYLSIVASLLSLQSEQPSANVEVRRTLVVEEIENGLFPSQAARVLQLLRTESRSQDVRLVATTHSPALLDALEPDDHAGVVICDRTKDGWSRLRTLVEHPRYLEVAGAGAIGRSVTGGLLDEVERPEPRSLSDLLG